MASPSRITVLISGNGSNLQALINACGSPSLPSATIVRCISNRKDAYGLRRAEAAGIPTAYHNLVPYGKQYPSDDPATKYGRAAREAYDARLAELVLEDAPDLVVCAGFMHVMSPNMLQPLSKAGVHIINLHPAKPGEFNGTNAIQRAWQAFQEGEISETGLMIHYVIDEVDTGEPIVVKAVALHKDEPLEQLELRIHEVEHVAIVEGTQIALDRKAKS